MALQVLIDGRRVSLSDADLVGEGGEARVFRVGDQAVKLFHPPATRPARQALERKLAKLRRFPASLPEAVVAPSGEVLDAQGAVVGYRMPLIEGGTDFGRLASRAYRDGALASSGVAALFLDLHRTLRALHGQQVVVGDLNDGNLLFLGGRAFLIDADSLQLPGFPCTVAHERFLDPRLYGVQLDRAPAFTEGSDWYAFAVLLFSSWLYVHPFGGTHPTLPTLLRRAEARHSVLRPDVARPRRSASPEVLPDDLRHHFHAVFERDERSPFPEGLLRAPWTRCRCGLEHARAACPACHVLGPVAARPVSRVRGRCLARVVFETEGRVVAAALQGGLRYAFEAEGEVRREDRSLVTATPPGPDAVYALQGPSTWVASPAGQVQRVEAGVVRERARTAVTGGRPVLGASSRACYRQEGAWLVEATTGARVGQVLDGQTRLWVGERLGLGLYRVGGLTMAFLLRVGKAGLQRLPEVSWSGRLLDAHAAFDAHHAVLTVASELDGRETVQRWLFDETGALKGYAPAGVRGSAAVLGGRVVVATDAGLGLLQAERGALTETATFPDSQPFVSAGDELLADADGSLFVIGVHDIAVLTLT